MPSEKHLIKQVMSILGSRKSEAKTKACRENARKPRLSKKRKRTKKKNQNLG